MENHSKYIFIVDDDIANLHAGKNALKHKHAIVTIQLINDLKRLLKRTRPSLILLDNDMPGMNGHDTVDELKTNPETAEIPVIIMYERDTPEHTLSKLPHHVSDYILKPLSPALLRKRVELHLRAAALEHELREYSAKEQLNDVVNLQSAVISRTADVIEHPDDPDFHHTENIQKYLKIMCGAMMRTKKYVEEISLWDIGAFLRASALHDIGKTKISSDIILKRSRLTDDEFEALKAHAAHGKDLLDGLTAAGHSSLYLEYAKDIAYAHHENWDGTGYPNALQGEQIPTQARMMAIADAYDALVSDRPYKKAFSHDEAMRIICDGRGVQFDPGLTDLFMSLSHEISEV